jgi:hypothetical protein
VTGRSGQEPADLELASIEVVKLHAERASVGTAEQARFDLNASYLHDGAVIHYRYDFTAHFVGDEGMPLGSAAASVMVTAHAVSTVDEGSIERFGATSGALMAYPYLREAILSLAQRTGFPGVLLPMIKPEQGGAGA